MKLLPGGVQTFAEVNGSIVTFYSGNAWPSPLDLEHEALHVRLRRALLAGAVPPALGAEALTAFQAMDVARVYSQFHGNDYEWLDWIEEALVHLALDPAQDRHLSVPLRTLVRRFRRRPPLWRIKGWLAVTSWGAALALGVTALVAVVLVNVDPGLVLEAINRLN